MKSSKSKKKKSFTSEVEEIQPAEISFGRVTPEQEAELAQAAAAREAMKAVEPETLLGAGYPYVPRKMDYSLELGWHSSDRDMVWVGGQIGRHVGRCLLTESETCQQYIDLIGGAGLREAESYGMFLGSLRWQYVNFPDRASTFLRAFGGAGHVSREGLNIWRPVVGAGIGVTTYLHRNVDVRLEVRAGAVDRGFVQALGGVQIKADNLLEYFATKLKALGIGTAHTVIDATGTAIKATEEGIEGIGEAITPQPSPTPAP